YVARSGCPVSARVDGPDEAARAIAAAWRTGAAGVVVAIPPPAELHGAEGLVEQAVRELEGVAGSGGTPRLLARGAGLSGGRSLDVNVELVVNNARIAAQVALAYAALA